MAECLTIIDHKGKKVILFDCRGMNSDQIAEQFPSYTQMAIENKINLAVSDTTGCTPPNDNMKKAAAESGEAVKAALGSQHLAMVGLKGMAKMIAQAMVKDQYFAKTLDDALDHLTAIE